MATHGTSKTGHGGARANAGRKPNEARDELARLLDKAFPVADREAMLASLGALAINGDIKAATLLLAYLYGRPVEWQEISGTDGAMQKIVVEYVQPKPTEAEDDE